MKTIKTKKAELLAHLKANRENHIDEYNRAFDAYREALIVQFEEALKKAKNYEPVSHHIDLEKPQNYLDSYDSAIEMLEWTTEDEIELDLVEFKQLVQDQWNWKQSFTAMARSYAG